MAIRLLSVVFFFGGWVGVVVVAVWRVGGGGRGGSIKLGTAEKSGTIYYAPQDAAHKNVAGCGRVANSFRLTCTQSLQRRRRRRAARRSRSRLGESAEERTKFRMDAATHSDARLDEGRRGR